MWKPSSTKNLTTLVRSECSAPLGSMLEQLLDRLGDESYAHVFVVVSMGGLWLTTAASYSDVEMHSKIFITSRPNALMLSVVPPRATAPAYGFRCTDTNAALHAVSEVFGDG